MYNVIIEFCICDLLCRGHGRELKFNFEFLYVVSFAFTILSKHLLSSIIFKLNKKTKISHNIELWVQENHNDGLPTLSSLTQVRGHLSLKFCK